MISLLIFAWCYPYSPVREYIELLSPLFEQDRLLPRTLMSVMSLEHLPYLYGTRLIPMEVCLANTFFFANTMNAKDMEVRLIRFVDAAIKLIILSFRSCFGVHGGPVVSVIDCQLRGWASYPRQHRNLCRDICSPASFS